MPKNDLAAAARALDARLSKLRFAKPADYVYRPLDYAWDVHRAYLERFAAGPKRVVFLGMNPGPYGMAQTGVPFGEVAAVRDWLGLRGAVAKPEREHPAKRVQGFDCPRSEVSGRRLWGLFAARFKSADAFAREHYVHNYCPLLFLEGTRLGRNVTPEELPTADLAAVNAACDEHLRALVDALKPEWVIGVGAFAQGRAREALSGRAVKIGCVLHPSPASPAANKGWAEAATRALVAQGVWS